MGHLRMRERCACRVVYHETAAWAVESVSHVIPDSDSEGQRERHLRPEDFWYKSEASVNPVGLVTSVTSETPVTFKWIAPKYIEYIVLLTQWVRGDCVLLQQDH